MNHNMLFFLYGPDTWTKKQKVNKIIDRFVREIDPSRMNVVVIGPEDADEENLRVKLTAPPFLARKRLIVLKNLITSVRRKAIQEIILEAIISVKDTTAIVVSEDDSKPKKWSNQSAKKLWEYLEKNAEKEEFKLLWGTKLEVAITKQAHSHGLVINKDAAVLLAVFYGGDFESIEQELQKLAAFCEDKKVELKDVQQLCVTKSEANIFNFLDALGNKDRQALLSTFAEQLREDEPLMLIARAIGHIRALLLMKTRGQAGAQALQMHPFQARKISAQMRNWDVSALKRFLFKLMMLDYAMKSGRASDLSTQLALLFTQVAT